MFEMLRESDDNALVILKKDHDKVQDLFDAFEDTDQHQRKVKLALQAIKELKAHAAIEEEIFYPAVRREVDMEIMNEADEEHHVAKVLIAELDNMSGDEDHFEAKFKVLAESVRHHIKEEENKMMPEVRDLDIDLDALGRELLERKQELLENGFPPTEEEQMVAGGMQKSKKSASSKRGVSKKAGKGRLSGSSKSSSSRSRSASRSRSKGYSERPRA
jgi:hypothetical protein